MVSLYPVPTMLDLELIKQHCRLEPDFDDDNELLETYSNAAQRLVENMMDRRLYVTAADIPVDSEGNPDERALLLDEDVTTAMLLLIGHWYANREAVVAGSSPDEMPFAVQALIQPYKLYVA